jgi:hypothetical protein
LYRLPAIERLPVASPFHQLKPLHELADDSTKKLCIEVTVLRDAATQSILHDQLSAGEEGMLRPRLCYLSLTSTALGAILLACVISSCNSQSFQYAPPPPNPTPPPVPAQPPPPPMNVARLLNGNWMATYPGGPLRVVIGLDPLLRGRNYVATLVDGNKDIPAGQVVWKGTLDPYVPGIVQAKQICADRGFQLARWVSARIIVSDASNFREELVNPTECSGFPVKYTRVGPAPTTPVKD